MTVNFHYIAIGMGCCHDRDFELSPPPNEEKITQKPAGHQSEGSVSGVPQASYTPQVMPEEVSSPRNLSGTDMNFKAASKSTNFENEIIMLKDREAHVVALMNTDRWISVYSTKELIVKFLSGSKFGKGVPVAYFYIDFGVDIGFDSVLAVLEDINTRKEWDESIQTIEITKVEDTEYETCYTKYQVFGTYRDFVERRHRVQTDIELRVTFFSVQDAAYPYSEHRATTHLGFYRISKTDRGTTDMLLFTQSDYRIQGEELQRFNTHRGEAAKGWLEAFQAKVQSLKST